MKELTPLVEQGIGLVSTGDRGDLLSRLEQTRQRLTDPSIRVIVVGEFKQGKSQLINALVSAAVCPVDDDVATSVPTVVRHGEKREAFVLVPAGEGTAGNEATDGDGAVQRRPIPFEDIAQYVSEAGNPGNARKLVAAEVYLPRNVLTGGLAVIDSPGVGGFDSASSLTTLTTLPTADAMILVSDASQEYTEPEIRFLRQAMRICPNVACALTKTDLYPDWRTVGEADRRHLNKVGGGIPLFPVSSVLRLLAAEENDPELNTESGFPALVAYLRHNVVGQSEELHRRSVTHAVLTTTDHLRLALQSELSALENPEETPQMIRLLESAKERADDQRRRSARWQVTLNDGVSDLISDMEYDLRDRMRTIQREAENAIDEGDPGPVWEQFSDWLEKRIAAAVSDTFVWTDERAEWLAGEVGTLFSEQEASLPDVGGTDLTDALSPVDALPVLDPGYLGVGQKVLIGMRGSYGGVLMFGLLTGLAGMALINPLSVGAGVLIGAKSYREDKEQRLKRRQAEAKALVRRQIDDVIFQVGKQLKDRLRQIQRTIRDHFTAIAEEHHRSLSDSLIVAQKAASSYTAGRDERVRAIKVELKRVDAVRKNAEKLSTPPAITAR